LFILAQRVSSIVTRLVFGTRIEISQAVTDGILTMFAAGKDRPNFLEISITIDCFYLVKSIFARDDNDFADTVGPLNCVDGMRDDRSASDHRKQFVETHSATVTGGDENGCKHRQKLKG